MARRAVNWITVAIAVIATYVGAGGVAKLLGDPYVHSSFRAIGLPECSGWFIGACEVLGCIGLMIRPLRVPAAAGLGAIMAGATWYHLAYTPPVQAVPALVLALLCGYVAAAAWRGRETPDA